MSKNDSLNESSKEDIQFNNIKKLLKDKNLNPKNIEDLQTLLNFTINPKYKKFNFEELIDFLLNYYTSENVSIFYKYFFQFCELSKLSYVKILLDNTIDVNCQNELGETPLHIAISKNDIELIKLLINYEPDTSLTTYRDNFTVMNYAEIFRNEIIIKMINELNENNNKKKIKTEIIDYINCDMNNIHNNLFKDTSSFISKNNINFDKIQNYSGEKMSIITDGDLNSSILTNHLNKNLQNSKLINLTENKNFNTQTIINESDFCEDLNPKEKKILILDKKKANEEKSPKILNEKCNKIKLSLKKEDNSIQNINLSINPSYIQSVTTCHTLNKEHNESPRVNNLSIKSLNKKENLFKFIEEINLPKKYADNLLDNGFDVLEVLISQTKNGTALTYQNLKDIGVKLPGERAKILIHLEEISGSFSFDLDKKVIYCNKINDDDKENDEYNSLYIFLKRINLTKYMINFTENGYYNVEILYIQMNSKQPLEEDILVNDLGINKFDAEKIIFNLIDSSKGYIRKQKKKNKESEYKTIIMEGNNGDIKSCEMCCIF